MNFWNFHPYILGEDEPILTHIFQMGWNHQLDDIIPKKFLKNPYITDFV